jgi:four helix bundle protein
MKDAPSPQLTLKQRTKAFALRIISLYEHLPKSTSAQTIGKQILRSGTSVGAQYREAIRAKSDADLISKLEGALQELEETAYWLELLSESGLVKEARLVDLQKEIDELISIIVKSVKTTKSRRKQ